MSRRALSGSSRAATRLAASAEVVPPICISSTRAPPAAASTLDAFEMLAPIACSDAPPPPIAAAAGASASSLTRSSAHARFGQRCAASSHTTCLPCPYFFFLIIEMPPKKSLQMNLWCLLMRQHGFRP